LNIDAICQCFLQIAGARLVMTGPNVAGLRVDRLGVTQEIRTLVLGADIGKNKDLRTRLRGHLEHRAPD